MSKTTPAVALSVWFVVAGFAAARAAADLPEKLQISQPFPQIVSQAATHEFVAPGIEYGEYDVLTTEGPLHVHVVAADLNDPSVRLETVLAHDKLNSEGETISSMAVRTGAVAGVNGDYFDIGATNQPIGIVVRNGALERAPSKYVAFTVDESRAVAMQSVDFSATADVQTIDVPMTAVNEFPPQGGVSLMTPAFGTIPPAADVSLARLSVLDGSPPFARYRIEAVDADGGAPPEYALAIGPAAYETLGTPRVGDVVTIAQTSHPDVAALRAAVGGGPLLVRAGERYDDPNVPAAEETAARYPVAGALVRRDGTLLLLAVEGRESWHSIGLRRSEFASLMLAFGANEGMSFDSGGSATLVTRRLGDRDATVRNVPSDGRERPVADGIFLYSDAPLGPVSRLVIRPSFIRAMPGARIPLTFAATDAAGHPLPLGDEEPKARIFPLDLGMLQNASLFVAGKSATSGVMHVERGTLSADIPVRVEGEPSRVVIEPQHADVAPGHALALSAIAYDAEGFPLAVPSALEWHTTNGRIDADGTFVAGDRDATVSVRLGDVSAHSLVLVGEREEPFELGTAWRYITVPAGLPYGVGSTCTGCISLNYDFTGRERSMQIIADRPLPPDILGMRMDVYGDGNGALLRMNVLDALGQRALITVGKLTWHGWQAREVRFPPDLAYPLKLHSIYVVTASDLAPVRAAGVVMLRNMKLILGGSGTGPAGRSSK
ncbi:MAG: phosphodiester glycosidase family protein [Candidatus Eremiobacteraeota bacterium]|nr:phosphodiester glycosidase family protein [Candidatus Eremiobacteraeota bacterium]